MEQIGRTWLTWPRNIIGLGANRPGWRPETLTKPNLVKLLLDRVVRIPILGSIALYEKKWSEFDWFLAELT